MKSNVGGGIDPLIPILGISWEENGQLHASAPLPQ
jgi:hypothetical protein